MQLNSTEFSELIKHKQRIATFDVKSETHYE